MHVLRGVVMKEKNLEKYIAYKVAHHQIKKAMTYGFYIEAIAIIESIITDRMISFINGYSEKRIDASSHTLGRAASMAKHICCKHAIDGHNLVDDVIEWSKRRNVIVHAIAKSNSGFGPPIPAIRFFHEAEKTAKEGLSLLKRVKAWHQSNLRKRTKTETATS